MHTTASDLRLSGSIVSSAPSGCAMERRCTFGSPPLACIDDPWRKVPKRAVFGRNDLRARCFAGLVGVADAS